MIFKPTPVNEQPEKAGDYCVSTDGGRTFTHMAAWSKQWQAFARDRIGDDVTHWLKPVPRIHHPSPIELADELFKIHSHAEHEDGSNDLVYYEVRLLPLLKKWGFPDPDWSGNADRFEKKVDLRKEMLKKGKKITMAFHCAGTTTYESVRIRTVGIKYITIEESEEKFDAKTLRQVGGNTFAGGYRELILEKPKEEITSNNKKIWNNSIKHGR